MSIIFFGILNLINIIYKPINWLEFFYFHDKLTINNNILKNYQTNLSVFPFYSFALSKNPFSISVCLINRYKSAVWGTSIRHIFASYKYSASSDHAFSEFLNFYSPDGIDCCVNSVGIPEIRIQDTIPH